MKRETMFGSAAQAVDAWLRSEPGLVLDASKGHASWTLRATHELLPEGKLRLSLPKGFPGKPAEVHIDRAHCLSLPHVETTGRYCHGVASAPSDYLDPVEAVRRVLSQVEALLERSKDFVWREAEFARESASYWTAFAALAQRRGAGISKRLTLEVDTSGVADWASGELEAFVEGPSSRRQIRRAVAAPASSAALAIANRHGRTHGTHVRGGAIFVRLSGEWWTPGHWPRNPQQLDDLIREVSGGHTSLNALMPGRKRQSRCAAVILLHGDATYAYLLVSPENAGFERSTMVPVVVRRVDQGWVLSRDQAAARLANRAAARVLVVGCGSLGAPVAEQIARTGIANLDLVDPQVLESENIGRHPLGLLHVGQGKAHALRDRISASVPGIKVTAHDGTLSELLETSSTPLDFDLIIDCTGESSARCAISANRFGKCSRSAILLSWLEPYGAAAHAVALGVQDNWPLDDPADLSINAGAWPGYEGVKLPQCGAGFHPYGMADVAAAAAFVARRALGILDGCAALPVVWSYIRSKEYFDNLPIDAAPRSVVASMGSPMGAMEIERAYSDLVMASDLAS